VTIRFRRRAEVVERVVGTTVFLARDESGALYRLNETGTALWRLLAVPTSRVEAIAAFRAAFPDRSAREIGAAVTDLLEALVEESLIEPCATTSSRTGAERS